jgi:hypothetical protein
VDSKNAGRDERDELAAPVIPTNTVASAALGETQATGIESNGTKKTKRRA